MARYESLKRLEKVADHGIRIPIAGLAVAVVAVVVGVALSFFGYKGLDEALKWCALASMFIALSSLVLSVSAMSLTMYIESKIDKEVEKERNLWKMMAIPDPARRAITMPEGWIGDVEDITHIYGIAVTVRERKHTGHKEGFVDPKCPECRLIIDKVLNVAA